MTNKAKRKVLTLEQKIQLGKDALELYREFKARKKGGWADVGKALSVTHTTAKRYADLYAEGGAEMIEDAHYAGKSRQMSSHPNKGFTMGNTRRSLWGPEFKYSDIWNHALFGKDISNLINGRV